MVGFHRFVWVERPRRGSHREFGQLLSKIRTEFGVICGIGSDSYWKRFQRDVHITMVVLLQTRADEHHPYQTTGFAAIKPGYGCRLAPRLSTPQGAAFSICTYQHPTTWYVELICAKSGANGVSGQGGLLLNEVERVARENGAERLALSALPYVVMFYYQKGFRLTMDVSGHEDAKLKAMAESIRAHLQDYRFKTVDDAFESPEFVKFLRRAVTLGLGANRQVSRETQGHKRFDCQYESCAEDGVYMTLFLGDKEMQFTPAPPKPRRSARIAEQRQRSNNK